MDGSPQGYLHKKLDVKLLILFILARVDTPMPAQDLYEVAYQDESLNYFTFQECLPELVTSGHLKVDEQNRYTITELGRQQGAQVEDSLAVPVVNKVSLAIDELRIRLRRAHNVTAEAEQDENGAHYAVLRYRDDGRLLMTLSLLAPDERVARSMAENLLRGADALYRDSMKQAIRDKKEGRRA